MKSFKDLKHNLKSELSSLPIIKVSLLGDTSTQLLATAIRGTAVERGYYIDLFEAEFNQVDDNSWIHLVIYSHLIRSLLSFSSRHIN